MREQFQRMFGGGDHSAEEVRQIPVDRIVSSPYQPRSVFDDERIEELSQTIQTHGMIQPIVVRKVGDTFELIAGERRWRAVRKLGHSTIPAIVRAMSDTQAASAALIENLQREGLTAIEEAVAYQQLLELHGLTQESLAQRLGKGQSTIANKLRLLHLPEEVQSALMDRTISERHARALLSLPDAEAQVKVLSEVVSRDLNVKQTEVRIKQLMEQNASPRARRVTISRDVRLALNTIRQSVDMIEKTGIKLQTSEADSEDYYEFVIRIPKARQGVPGTGTTGR